MRAGKTGPNVCFEIKGIKRGLFGVICPVSSLSLPRPPHCHLMGSLTPNPQAFALQPAAWLEATGKQGEEGRAIPTAIWLLPLCTILSSGSSTRLSLQQGPSAPHPSWRRASRRALLFGKGSLRIFLRTPIFMAAVGAWIKAILSNYLGLLADSCPRHAPLCHPSIPGQPRTASPPRSSEPFETSYICICFITLLMLFQYLFCSKPLFIHLMNSPKESAWQGYYNYHLYYSRYGKDFTLELALRSRKYTCEKHLILEQLQLVSVSVPTCIIQLHLPFSATLGTSTKNSPNKLFN